MNSRIEGGKDAKLLRYANLLIFVAAYPPALHLPPALHPLQALAHHQVLQAHQTPQALPPCLTLAPQAAH